MRVLLICAVALGAAPARQPQNPSPMVEHTRTHPGDLAATGARRHGRPQRVMVTHSEIFPGTYASTTETANYLLQQLHLARRPVPKWLR
jgi:hypothetical protein